MNAARRSRLPHGASGVPCAERARTRRVGTSGALALAALLAGPLAATAEPPPTEVLRDSRFDNGVVAVVDGDPITLRELKKYGVASAPFLPSEVRNDYRELLDNLIEQKLLKSEFEKNGITAPDEMVDRYIASVLQEKGISRTELEADIARAGLTWKDYHDRMREEVQKIQLVNLLIRSRVNVPEEEVRRVWESDPKYLQSEKLVVAAIYLPGASEEDAEKVHKEAKSDFEDAAKAHSKGPAASEGGVLGEFERGTMAPHFEKALEGLGKGDVSEPVAAPGGWYIVKLVGTKSSGRREFEDVKAQLSEQLYEQRLSDRYEKWVTEDLRKEHRVDNLMDSLAMIAAGSGPAPARSAPAPQVPAATPPPAPPATPQ
jgi:parvulin-like peptidyl-prolyl isomerase